MMGGTPKGADMKAPRLKALARQIEEEFPDLRAVAEPGGGYCNTDRNIPGTRLRHPGKGRRGTLLTVWSRDVWPHDTVPMTRDRIYYQHNAAETYRNNEDVIDWIAAEKRRRGLAAPPAPPAEDE